MEANNKMAIYMAEKILLGQQSYEKVFSFSLYLRYQDEVDMILTLEGREDLIKR